MSNSDPLIQKSARMIMNENNYESPMTSNSELQRAGGESLPQMQSPGVCVCLLMLVFIITSCI